MLIDLCCFLLCPRPPRALKSVPLVGWDFPQARDDSVPSLRIWTIQPVIAKQATCMGLPLSLKYPVNVYKSLCTHRIQLLSPWFFLHILSTVQLLASCGLKSSGQGQFLTPASAAGLDFAGDASAQQTQPYRYHWSVQHAPLVLWDGCGPIRLPIAGHQSLSVPGYCAVWTAPSSSIKKNNPGSWMSGYMHEFLWAIKAGRED